MSGICGVLYPDVFQVTHLISPMLNTLEHRGKGQHQVYTHRSVQIGCCGGKLTSNEKKNIVCALDGSLAGKDKLIKELSQADSFPSDQSDTGLIIAAYEVWGIKFPEKIDGNFVIAIFDQSKEQLMLVRDRIGVKPLYWAQKNNLFLFASELKALLATGSIPQSIATDAIASYLYFGYIPQDMTPVESVNKLLPSFSLTFALPSNMRIEPYWSLSSYFTRNHRGSADEIKEHIDHLITHATRIRLPKDGPIGCLISGGLGSASTAYYVQKLANGHPIEAFTAGFTGHNDEDIAAAREVTKTLSLPHQVSTISPKQFVDKLAQIVWYLDEPLADPNAVAAWYLTEAASKRTPVVFSGMGSDEFLAGHTRYSKTESTINPIQHCYSNSLTYFKSIAIPLLSIIWQKSAFRYLKRSRTDPWQFEFMQRNAIFDKHSLAKASPSLHGLFDPEVFLHKFNRLHTIKSGIGALTYIDIKTRLVDCFVTQYERMCTAHGLTWETPFLDTEFMQFAAGLSETTNANLLKQSGVLKELMQNVFPEKFLLRPKRTRTHFLGDWAILPPIRELFNKLTHGTLVETGVINEGWIRETLKNTASSPYAFRQLWSLLILEVWVQIFINRRIEPNPPRQPLSELLSLAHPVYF